MTDLITGISTVLISGVFAYFISLYTSKNELKKIDKSHQYKLEASLFEKRIENYKPALNLVNDLHMLYKWKEDGKATPPFYLEKILEELKKWNSEDGATIMSKDSRSSYLSLRYVLEEIWDSSPNEYLSGNEVDAILSATDAFYDSLSKDTDPKN